jgi:hypothetical protein
LLEQLEVLPEFVAACGFQNAKAPGFEADDFLAAAPPFSSGHMTLRERAAKSANDPERTYVPLS